MNESNSNCTPPTEIKMNDNVLEVVEDHEYLGSIISAKGRKNDLLKRIADCKGVINEIVEICRNAGVTEVCLTFLSTLIDTCFKMKFKHGCEVWDTFTKFELTTINKLIPNMIKRTLKVPGSTPTAAVKHDLGVIDLDVEVAMERILLASKVLQLDDSRISKQLLSSMMEKRVPGFCTALEESLKLLGINDVTELDNLKDKRKYVKDFAVETQRKRIIIDMLKGSKTDDLLLNFNYDGRKKDYLTKLPYEEARIIFMWRSRMFPSKCNFPDRWSSSKLCNFCCTLDTDEHLLQCCGYMDIHQYQLNHKMFMVADGDWNELKAGAQMLMEIYERLLVINEDGDVNK